jgi:large subunit ribosomal protein L21
MDAVVRTGGKQYRVHEGSIIDVARLAAEPGSRVELRDVLLVSNDGNVTVGAPIVDGATVVAEVVDHGKGKKVINFRYKAKVRFRRKQGHRQPYTRLAVREILTGGASPTPVAPAAPARRTRRSRAAATEEVAAPASEAPVTEAPVAAVTPEPAAETPAEETARPRRRRRAASEPTESTE